ncbi:hypothetical protein BaRGS_00037340 [Batillaria attramentaria]|uniref:CEP63/Deup1 N-terminal domain-containing protein n=1 Tax=Batillaria attramentaria TaxID=370345 RepID=A0ABD0J8Z5_9CAEN
MERISSVWNELQRSNKLPSSSLMSSCQTELQELMYQLDVMLSAKKQQWLQETEELQTRLHAKERELRSQQTALEMKTMEMEDMKSQMEGLNKAQKAIVDEYEDHLSKLRSEVLKVRKEYEKLHKQHQRYKKDLQRKKEQVLGEKKESDQEIQRLREKLEEYERRESDWEAKQRSQQNEIDMLEAQRRTLVEKCEFIQQQTQSYQNQIGRRREMQSSAEETMNARISQLDATVERSTQTIAAQKDKIEKLKSSLDDAMSSHKQTMADNEKLLDDLQKANETIQVKEERYRPMLMGLMLEDRIAELEAQLRSKTELLQAAQEDTHQYSHDISRLENTLSAKDDIIKKMGDTRYEDESEQVKRLKDALYSAKEDLRSHKKNMKQLEQNLASTTSKLDTSQHEQEGIKQRYKEKETELSQSHSTEVRKLQLEVKRLQDKLSTVNESHTAELAAMRKNLAELTTELYQRNTTLASLSEKSSDLERSMRDESGTLDKRVAELKVAQAQIEALRSENRLLRRTVLHHRGDGFHKDRQQNVNQSQMIRREMNALRNSVEDVELIVRSQHNSARTDTSHASALSDRHSGSQGNTEAGSERFSAMDDYLDSSIRRYDDQLHYLEAQKARLQAQMSQSSRQNMRKLPYFILYLVSLLKRENYKSQVLGGQAIITMTTGQTYHQDTHPGTAPPHFNDSQGTILESEAMSFVSDHQYPKVDRLILSNSSSEDELPDMSEEATKAFYNSEHQRAQELEQRLNAQIDNFSHGYQQ